MKGNKGLGPGAMFSNANPVNCRWFLCMSAESPWFCGTSACWSVARWVSKAQAGFSVERFPKQLLLIPCPIFLYASSLSHH